MDFTRFTHLSFDCYGTLIDWESGILAALRAAIPDHAIPVDDDRLLELYAKHEAAEEAGPFRSYREILRGVMDGIASEMGFTPSAPGRDAIAASVGRWEPFPDTVAALTRLKTRFQLVILSNVDRDMFTETARRLEVPFDAVFVAEEIGSYKPSRENFRYLLDHLGVPREQVLHVAQSVYHDHVPAKELGFSTVWVNRPSRRSGTGAAPLARAKPDLELPSLAAVANTAGV